MVGWPDGINAHDHQEEHDAGRAITDYLTAETKAMRTYEETPREKWLFYYPAQVSLAGTQIWWTSEVGPT